MPYCPKCDMEFVEGITICTDCGGPLAESEEAYRKELQKQREQELAGKASLYGFASGSGDGAEPQAARPEDIARAFEAAEAAPQRHRSAGPYISVREKCENLRSSSFAFLLVGAAITAFSAACWAGIIRLPVANGSRLLFQGVITAMGLAFLFISFRAKASIAALQTQIENEERRTKELIGWFLSSWDAERLDQEILKEDSSISEAELDLKRFALIQDLLITGQDLPDPSYADFLSEEIFEKLYQL